VESPYFKSCTGFVLFLLSKYCFELVLYDASLFLSRLYFLRTIPLLLTWIMRSSVRNARCLVGVSFAIPSLGDVRVCVSVHHEKKGRFVSISVTPLPPGMFRFCYFYSGSLHRRIRRGINCEFSVSHRSGQFRLLSLIIPDIEFFLWLTIFELGFFLSTRCTTSYFIHHRCLYLVIANGMIYNIYVYIMALTSKRIYGIIFNSKNRERLSGSSQIVFPSNPVGGCF
jgi:hypothetical protein